MNHLFSMGDFDAIAHTHPGIASHWTNSDFQQFVQLTAQSREIPTELERRIETSLQNKITSLQRADREYWKPIIAELRSFKARNELHQEGSLV